MKKTLLLYLFAALFILPGCEKENYQNEITPENKNQSSGAKIEALSLDELSNDKQFNEIAKTFELEQTFASAKNSSTEKQTPENDDFEIDFSSGNKFESKNGVSYTFIIKNDEEIPTHFENLIVEKHNDGSISGFIAYYEYSQNYLDNMKKGIVIPFEGNLRRTANYENFDKLKDFFKNEKKAKTPSTAKTTGTICIETGFVIQSLCPTGTHSNGQYCNVINGIWYGYQMQTVTNCIIDGIGSWGWVSSSSNYTSTLPDPNVTSGGGSYSTSATVQPNLYDSVTDIQRFVKYYGLTGNEIEWARYRPNRIAIEYFMEENYYTDFEKGIVKNVASQIVANTSLTIDLHASLNSPMNVDKLAVRGNTPEVRKFSDAYDALTNSPLFKKLFVDLFGSNSRFNVKFVIGKTTTGANGETNTDLLNPTDNIITIDPDFLNNNSKLVVAKTILHECIHAYLNVKLCDSGQGMSISTLNNMDFWNTVNQKYNGFNGSQDQHNFIYNYMLPTMQTILSQVKDLLVSVADNTNIINTVVYPDASNPTISVPFNWSDCYLYLSLNGLQNCTFFQNEIGIYNADGTFNTVVDLTRMNYVQQYKDRCHVNLH